MAKGGDKRRVESNRRTLNRLRSAIVIAEVLHIVVRLVVFSVSTSVRHYVGLAVTTCIYFLCFRALSRLAAPTHGTGGELIHGGSDLAQPGFTGYYFDAIYICIAVQLATILSDWFWLLFLSAPAYGLYKLWRAVIQPWLAAPRVQQDQPETDGDRKKRERTEKRAERRRMR